MAMNMSVCTQTELDNLLEKRKIVNVLFVRFDDAIIKDCGIACSVVITQNKSAEVYGSGDVESMGISRVVLHDSAFSSYSAKFILIARDLSSVISAGSSIVTSFDRSTVVARGDSIVHAHDRSTVFAGGDSLVRADGEVVVYASGNAMVSISGNARVVICGGRPEKAFLSARQIKDKIFSDRDKWGREEIEEEKRRGSGAYGKMLKIKGRSMPEFAWEKCESLNDYFTKYDTESLFCK